MRYGYPLAFAGSLVTTLLLVSCGGGGAGSGDVFPWSSPADSVITGPNSFLLFPNPQVQTDGSLQTNTAAYAQAYYEAIDPNNDKDTLARWKAANGFGNTATGTETTVVFGDVKDLGYGRRITARQNTDGTAAVMVENYLVSPATSYAYSSLNLDAAVVRDPRWHIGTNGIEFSGSPCTSGSDPTGCNPNVNFAKFYTFDPVTGQRKLMAELDGRGDKAMPGICITCHGGRGDPLTPPDTKPGGTGKPLFPLVAYSATQKRGDVQAHLQPLDVDSFGFSVTPGFTRADQEAALKTINQMVLLTYPIPAAATPAPEDVGRRLASGDEWQGTAAAVIKNAYGGDGLPNATFSDTYAGDAQPIPGASPTTSWATNGQLNLYQGVIVPSCRTCHILRGTGPQSDIDFDKFATTTFTTMFAGTGFKGYTDSIKEHIVDRGNMPLAKIVSDKYYSTDMADTMATFLDNLGLGFVVRDSAGVVLKPGRPVAVPGPDRVVKQGNTSLSAAGSWYATTYAWSITTNPGGGALVNPNSATPTFSASVNGTYVLQLVVGNGATLSDPVPLTIVVDSTLPYTPTALRFSDIKAVLQTPGACTICHTPSHVPTFGPPIYYTNIDRNGDTFVDATDDDWFYTELRGRINFTDIAGSPLLRKPSGYHHGGGPLPQPGFDTSKVPGDPLRAKYDLFLNWILNGAPE